MKPSHILTLLLCLTASLCQAQAHIEQQVNESIWKPFSESWSAGDAKAFNALHTDDILRASRSGLEIGEAYKQSNVKSFAGRAQYPGKRSIHFSFEQRTYSENIGYEVGYYKVVVSREGEEDRRFYARFHVVLKKENGRWKIAQDWDTNNIAGRPITAEDWESGTQLEF